MPIGLTSSDVEALEQKVRDAEAQYSSAQEARPISNEAALVAAAITLAGARIATAVSKSALTTQR